MDVETERVERTVTRSPKDKILVDSGDKEENKNASLNKRKWLADLHDDVTTVSNNDKEAGLCISTDSSEQKALTGEEVESTGSVPVHESSVSSEVHLPKMSAGVAQFQETYSPSELLASSEPNNDEELLTDVVQAHEPSASSELPSSSELHDDEEMLADVAQTHDTSASLEPRASPQMPNGDVPMSTGELPVHETVASSKLLTASQPQKEADDTTGNLLSKNATVVSPDLLNATETLKISDEKPTEVLSEQEANTEVSSDGSDRLVLTDEVSSASVEHGQFEHRHLTADVNSSNNNQENEDQDDSINNQELSGDINSISPTGVEEDATQEWSNVRTSVLGDQNACREGHSSDQELVHPLLDKLDDIKEPDEPDHATECQLLHDNKETTETTSSVNGSPTVNKKEDDDGWIYILGHDKLKKRVIKEGLEKTRPLRGQVVTVNCVGRLEDGTEIDKHENWSLALGEDDFIHAFDLCVALMDKGEICEVFTDSRFAYGELGRAPDVPPNAAISYIIELIDYHDKRAYSTMTVAERIQLSNEKRERGNYLYSRNEFSRSIDSYTRALKALDEDFESRRESPEELQELIDTRIKCHNNMAAAQMKVGAWDAAAVSCGVVLKVQPENVKALFRKGKCLANKGDVSAAIPLLKRALKLEPETRIIHQELSRLERKNKAQTETEKAMYQKMLGTDKEPEAKKKKENTSKWLWYVVGGAAAVLVSLGLTAYRYVHV